MYKRIAAFGASVTQQENGYADQLSEKLGVKIKKFGYGGMHLPDAGVCFIDKVLSYKPDLCFIDWFSTGYMECTELTQKCIDTILYKFSSSHSVVVFLFLPGSRSDESYNEKEKFYDFCRNVLKERKAVFIDISNELKDIDLSLILRDSIHTTIYGAGYYADIIKEKLQTSFLHVLNSEEFAKNAVYKSINKTVVNRVFFKNIDFYLDGNILGLYGTIGRHSGICNIKYDNGIEKKVALWDRWCHFERNHFDFVILPYKGKICIEILQDEFDTSSCKVPVDFKKYRKQVVCREIYWQGTSLDVKNTNEGSALALYKIEVVRQLREIKHYVGKCLKKIKKCI